MKFKALTRRFEAETNGAEGNLRLLGRYVMNLDVDDRSAKSVVRGCTTARNHKPKSREHRHPMVLHTA